jgi:hypothetical protein
MEKTESLSEQLANLEKHGQLHTNPEAGELKEIDEPIEPTDITREPEAAPAVKDRAAQKVEPQSEPTERAGDPFPDFHRKRTRATLELADGTFSIPVIGAQATKYSVCLFVPLSDGAVTFVPKPGTRLTISVDNVSEEVYFPGTYTEVDSLNLGIMHLIKAEES